MAEDEQVESGFDGEIDDGAEILELLEEDGAEEENIEAKIVSRESKALRYIIKNHPECKLDYLETVLEKLPVKSYVPDNNTDSNHRSMPFITKFERTKIIGFRANQLAKKARPLIDVPKYVTDVVEIARLEFEAKRLPFILKRPMPDGTYEYWRLQDLMIL